MRALGAEIVNTKTELGGALLQELVKPFSY